MSKNYKKGGGGGWVKNKSNWRGTEIIAYLLFVNLLIKAVSTLCNLGNENGRINI